MQKLQVHHIADTSGDESAPHDDSRVTINPFALQTVVTSDVEIRGTKLKRVTIFYADTSIIQLNVSSFDAMAIEDAVGSVPEF